MHHFNAGFTALRVRAYRESDRTRARTCRIDADAHVLKRNPLHITALADPRAVRIKASRTHASEEGINSVGLADAQVSYCDALLTGQPAYGHDASIALAALSSGSSVLVVQRVKIG